VIGSRQIILYAENDENDGFLFGRGFKQAGVTQELVVLPSGKDAIAYLNGDGEYVDRGRHPLPCLVLLDLNLPGLVSGLDVLKWIRTTPNLCTVVTLMLTSSNKDADIHRAYLQGANGYLIKPGRLDEIVAMAKAVKDFWLVQNRSAQPK
jgi:CheY-like chemotaxis protein